MVVKLDQIVINGQIEVGHDFNKYLEKLKEGITELTEMAPYVSTKVIEEKYGLVKGEQRKIVASFRNEGILYLVTDTGIPVGKNMQFPIRTKGYAQKLGKEDGLKEIINRRFLEKLFENVGYKIGSDSIE